MDKHTKHDLPWIAYLTAILGGILLFLLFGEALTGIKPNLTWIAWVTSFLISLVGLWSWVRWRDRNRK